MRLEPEASLRDSLSAALRLQRELQGPADGGGRSPHCGSRRMMQAPGPLTVRRLDEVVATVCPQPIATRRTALRHPNGRTMLTVGAHPAIHGEGGWHTGCLLVRGTQTAVLVVTCDSKLTLLSSNVSNATPCNTETWQCRRASSPRYCQQARCCLRLLSVRVG